ncbi:MAG: DUF4418 family protein [Nitrospirae bacterium]|nr:DUF4418 family protein [Nitrospirota bacterium]
MINWKFGIILFFMGLMVLLVPRYILPVCGYQGFEPMTCTQTAIAEMFMGFVVMTASAGMAFSKGRQPLRWLSLTTLAAGISVIWIPEAIGHCHSTRMPCNYGTVPVLRLLGVLIILLSLASSLLSLKKERD